jgi:hypothetical protein
LVEIIKVVGTPTREEIQAMNQNYTEFKFPQIKAHPWSKVRARIRSLASFPQQMKMGCAGIPIESTG